MATVYGNKVAKRHAITSHIQQHLLVDSRPNNPVDMKAAAAAINLVHDFSAASTAAPACSVDKIKIVHTPNYGKGLGPRSTAETPAKKILGAGRHRVDRGKKPGKDFESALPLTSEEETFLDLACSGVASTLLAPDDGESDDEVHALFLGSLFDEVEGGSGICEGGLGRGREGGTSNREVEFENDGLAAVIEAASDGSREDDSVGGDDDDGDYDNVLTGVCLSVLGGMPQGRREQIILGRKKLSSSCCTYSICRL